MNDENTSKYKPPPLPDADPQSVKEESVTFRMKIVPYLTSTAPPSTSPTIPMNVHHLIIMQRFGIP
jgi:hypothetical protein